MRAFRPFRRLMSSRVELTATRYPKVKRMDFSRLQEEDFKSFEAILGSNNVLKEDLEAFNTDWMGTVRGQAEVVLRPRTTEEVAAVLAHCGRRRLAVCPQGGNTGLVGGSVPVFDEVVVSTTLMNKIEGKIAVISIN